MKKFYRKMIIGFVTMLLVLILVMLAAIFIIWNNSMRANIRQMIRQAEQEYDRNLEENAENVALHEKDFLNRAVAVEYILQKESSLISSQGLREVRDAMDVKTIYLFDAEGTVIASSEDRDIDRMAEADTRLREFITDQDSAAYGTYWRADEEHEESQSLAVALKSGSDAYKVLMVDIEGGVHRLVTANAVMKNTLSSMVTDYGTTVLALSKETGEILAITENNPQEFKVLGNRGEEISLLERVQAAGDDVTYLRLDTGDVIAACKEMEDYMLVAFVATTNMRKGIFLQVAIFLGIVLAAGVLGLLSLSRYWNRYLVQDLNKLKENIDQVLAGDFRGETHMTSNEDLNALAQALDSLKEGYIDREERMSRIAGSLGGNIALFDCVRKSGLTFFSSNMREILGMKSGEWKEVRDDYHRFELLINRLLAQRDEDGISHFGGRHLDIRMTQDENGLSGVVLDASDEVIRRNKLVSRLTQVESAAFHDSMTGLLNRAGFEKKIIQYLNQEDPVGVMLMMDLDNFKRVNDTMGHPEGDYLIGLVGRSLKRAFLDSDIVAHLSGDEFTVLMPTAFTVEALRGKLDKLLEHLRRDITDYSEKCGVSMSVGAVFVRAESYAELYRQADSALYIAKQMGKNCYYINEEHITCMRVECISCRPECPKRKALGLDDAGEEKEQG